MQQRCSCFFLNNRLALFLVFFVLPAPLLYAPEPVAGAPLLVEGLGKGTVALDGQWQFRVGDDSAWSSPTLDDRDWERLRVDRPWGTKDTTATQALRGIAGISTSATIRYRKPR